MKYSGIIMLSLVMLVSTSCNEDNPEPALSPAAQLTKDIGIIEDYLQAEGLVAQKTSSGLHYIITDEGAGGNPTSTSDVDVTYRGYLPDKTEFDGGGRTTFNLRQVIPGWTEGIPLFKKGGKGVLLIPSALGYGNRPPTSSIPVNSVLIFDVELHAFL